MTAAIEKAFELRLAKRFVSDDLWNQLYPVIVAEDPKDPGRFPCCPRGPHKTDARIYYEAILYRELTRCGWNQLPRSYPSDTVVWRQYHHWMVLGILPKLYRITLRYFVARGHYQPNRTLYARLVEISDGCSST